MASSLLRIFESLLPKYKVGQTIYGLGKISNIYQQKTGSRVWFQYKIDGSFYAEEVVEDAFHAKFIDTINLNKIRDLVQKIEDGNGSEADFRLAEKVLRFMDGRPEKLRKYDRGLFTRLTWVRANLISAISNNKPV